MKILHNPRCSKSRETLRLLEESGKDVEIIEYLKDTPSEEELRKVLALLGIPAEQLVRKNEGIYKENFQGKSLSEAEWIKAMITFPKLIERPVVIDGNRAVIGRPPENVKQLL
ncbi:arsenate reductase (glutaredoxin) [Wandonia haliotis]|uniref:Arsenate reductase (Glutaredoxin) n=1 Tax=Wandonia haliotis TaxID=574963 RepID=A0ABP3Y0M9_9FLAO